MRAAGTLHRTPFWELSWVGRIHRVLALTTGLVFVLAFLLMPFVGAYQASIGNVLAGLVLIGSFALLALAILVANTMLGARGVASV